MNIPTNDMLTTEEALTAIMVIFAQRGRAIREAQQRQHTKTPGALDSGRPEQSSHIVEPVKDQGSFGSNRT